MPRIWGRFHLEKQIGVKLTRARFLSLRDDFNELGAFIPPLMSKATKPTLTGIFYDQPLVYRNQLHYEDLGGKNSMISSSCLTC